MGMKGCGYDVLGIGEDGRRGTDVGVVMVCPSGSRTTMTAREKQVYSLNRPCV